MLRRTNMKNAKLSLHILKFDPSMSRSSHKQNIMSSWWGSFPRLHTTYPCILSNHGEEITMSLIGAVMWMQTFIYNIVNCVNHFHMFYLQCPYSSKDPGSRQFQEVSGRRNSPWCGWGTSLGIQWKWTQYPRPLGDRKNSYFQPLATVSMLQFIPWHYFLQ